MAATTKKTLKVPSKDVLDLPFLPDDQATIDRLVAMVPPKERLEEYVHRTFEDGLTDFELFEYAHQTGQNIMLPGPTGSGKSHALEAYAAWKRIPFGWLDGSRLTRIDDVYGEYLPSEADAKALHFVEGDFTLILRWGGVYVIEEMNMILEGVSARLFTVFDDHRTIQLNNALKEKVRGDNRTLLAACYNPGYAGGRELNRALKRRFLVRKWGYDRKTEESLIQSKHLLDVSFSLRQAVDNGVLDTPVPTSALIEFEQRTFQLGEARGFETGFLFAKSAFLDQFEAEEVGAVRIAFENNEGALKNELYNLWFAPAEKKDAAPKKSTAKKSSDPAKGLNEAVAGGSGAKSYTRMRSRNKGTCLACDKTFPAKDIILYGGKVGGKSLVYHDNPGCRPADALIKDSRALQNERNG